MAEKKTIELEVKSNLADAEKSLGSLKSQLRNAQAEVASLSDKFGATSKEAVNAAKNAAILADKIGDAKALTDAFNPDAKFKALSGSLNGIAGGFSVVTGVMGTLGTESKDVEQAILKVQSAMAIASGAQAIGESVDQFRQLGAVVKSYAIVQKAITAGQWLWNAAMAANPIGLLIAGIAALIAGGVALTNYFKSNAIAAEKNAASIKANKTALENQSKAADKAGKSLQTNNDYQLEMAKATGASTAAIRKLELKLIDEKIAFADSSREIAKNTYHKNLNALASLKAADADEEQIKLQEEITQKSLEEFGKQTKNLNDANAEKGNIIRKQNVEIRQEQTNHNKEIRDKNKEASTKAKEDAIATAKELAAEKKKNDEEIAKVYRDKQITEEYAINDAIDAAKKANLDAGKSVAQLAIEAEDAAYKLKYDMAVKYGHDTTELEKQHIAIQVTNAKTYGDEIKKIEEEKIAVKRKALDDLQAIFGTETAMGKAVLLAKQALAIQEMVMSIKSTLFHAKDTATKATITAAGAGVDIATGAAKTVGAAPFPANIPLIIGYAATAIGIAMSIKSALTKVKGAGSGGSAPSMGGGGGAAVTPAAPSFNVVGASSTNQLAQTIGNQQQQPIKAYVVSNDVTTAQSLDRNIISSASIG